MQKEFLMAAILREAKNHVESHPEEYRKHMEKAKTRMLAVSEDQLTEAFAKATVEVTDDPVTIVEIGFVLSKALQIIFHEEEK